MPVLLQRVRSVCTCHRAKRSALHLVGVALCLAALSPQSAQAQSADKNALRLQDINPIMSFEEQAKRLSAECSGDAARTVECEKKRKQHEDVLKALRAICRETPDDDRCGAIQRKKPVSRIKQFCLENPYEYKCVRRRELHKIREKRLRKYCAKNPDAPRCKSKSSKQTSHLTFAEKCKMYPKNRRCLERKERDERDAKQQDPEANTF